MKIILNHTKPANYIFMVHCDIPLWNCCTVFYTFVYTIKICFKWYIPFCMKPFCGLLY